MLPLTDVRSGDTLSAATPPQPHLPNNLMKVLRSAQRFVAGLGVAREGASVSSRICWIPGLRANCSAGVSPPALRKYRL